MTDRQSYLISESSLLLRIKEELDSHNLLVPCGPLDAAKRPTLRELSREEGIMQLLAFARHGL